MEVLKSGENLRHTIASIMSDLLKLECDTRAEGFVNALIVLEKRWADHDYKLTDDMEEFFRTCDIVDKINKVRLADTSFMKNVNPKVSPYVLAWINSNAQNNKWYLGLLFVFSHLFYQTHKRDDLLTLEWIMNTIGPGRMIDSYFAFKLVRQLEVAPVAVTTAENPEPRYIYESISADDFYDRTIVYLSDGIVVHE